MGRALRIGVYSPYFGSTVGGGEKYLGVAAESLRDAFPEHSVAIVSPRPTDRKRYEQALNLDLAGIELVAINKRVTPFHRLAARARPLRGLRNRVVASQAERWTRGYDLLLAMAYVIPVASRARLSVVLCQFPYELRTPEERRALDDFETVVCQSEYVRGWTAKRWERQAAVVNPPIDIPAAAPDPARKRRLILSVGRFVAGGHNKRHDLLVEAFAELCREGLSGWELHLAGSVHRDAASREYLARVRKLAQGHPVHLHVDRPYDELARLYEEASIYWHAAGYGVDEARHPDALEHFGMATAEAMAHGAVPVVIGRGGQLEVVRDGVDGRTWLEPDELRRLTLELVGDAGLRRRLGQAAQTASARWSRASFKSGLLAELTPLVRRLEAGS